MTALGGVDREQSPQAPGQSFMAERDCKNSRSNPTQTRYTREIKQATTFSIHDQIWMLGLCEDSQTATRALLPHQVHPVLVVVFDLELGRRGGGLGEHFALAEASAVAEELFLEIFGNPSLDDDITAVALERKEAR